MFFIQDENYILTSIPKPILRAFEYTRFLKGKNLSFDNIDNEIYGVITLNDNLLSICLVQHNDMISKGQNIELNMNIKHDLNIGDVKISSRIDLDSCNPYETWRKIGSPKLLSLEQWNEIKKTLKPKKAIINNIQIGDRLLNFNINVNAHSFNFVQFEVN